MEGCVKKKMGGTLWEEPVFFLTHPGMKLQIFWGKGKNNFENLCPKVQQKMCLRRQLS